MASEFTSALDALQATDPGSVANLLKVQIENMEASGLDHRTYALTRLAALIALDGPVVSYMWALNLAEAAGVKDVEIKGLVIALTPTVGYARILTAGAKMREALEMLE